MQQNTAGEKMGDEKEKRLGAFRRRGSVNTGGWEARWQHRRGEGRRGDYYLKPAPVWIRVFESGRAD